MTTGKKEIDKKKISNNVKGKGTVSMKSKDYLDDILKKSKDLVKAYKITVKKNIIDEKINLAAKKYQPNMKVQGFRKGKVTLETVKKQFKKELESEVIGDLTSSEIYKKINQEKIQSVGQPTVEKVDYQEGKDLNIEFSVELFPKVEIDLDTIVVELEKSKLKYPEYNEVENINQLLKSYSKYEPKADPKIQDGDMVLLNIQSRNLKNNKKFPKKKERYNVTKENNFEILDINKEIIAKKTGDKIVFTREYPVDYSNRPWAGKKIEHVLVIEKVLEIIQRKMDKKFLQEIGVKDEKELKLQLKKQYDESKEQFLKNTKTELILDSLCEMVEFLVPKSMLEQYLKNSQIQIAELQEKDDKDKEKKIIDIYKNVLFSVKKAFIINHIREVKDIKVEEKDIDEKIKELSAKQGMSFSQFKKLINGNDQYKEQLTTDLSSQKISDFLISNIKIKEV
jgi:trigger factor